MNKKARGFTIVELLIVIVVIGILAAISIVAYNNIQNRAHDNIVKSDIASIRKKLEIAKMDIGHYPRTLDQFPADVKITKGSYDEGSNNVYYITNAAGDTYAIGLRSKSLRGFIFTNTDISEGVTVSGSHTATAISATWGSGGAFNLQGYDMSANPRWRSAWTLVN